jgi:hypothetical protein
MRKQKPIRREDCRTEAQKLAYSRQQYERRESMGELPSGILDLEKFPLETEPWHSGEYWIAVARAGREKRPLLH